MSEQGEPPTPTGPEEPLPAGKPGSARASRQEFSRRRSQLILSGIVLAMALTSLLLAFDNTYRRDAAVLFVALPTLVTLAVIFAPPAKSLEGTAFKAVSIGLLITSIWLHEGAICVLMASPLVYGVTAIVLVIHKAARRNRGAYAILPIVLLSGLEGVTPGVRVQPVQTVTIERAVDLTPAAVAERVERGPHPVAVRSTVLRAIGMPAPTSIAGVSVAEGAQWTFCYHDDAHGPGGQLVAEVAESRPAQGHLAFTFPSDTSISHRWVRWQRATIDWRSDKDGRTRVVLTITFERGLDPSWYFGPLQQGLVHEGGGYLLDSLDLR